MTSRPCTLKDTRDNTRIVLQPNPTSSESMLLFERELIMTNAAALSDIFKHPTGAYIKPRTCVSTEMLVASAYRTSGVLTRVLRTNTPVDVEIRIDGIPVTIKHDSTCGSLLTITDEASYIRYIGLRFALPNDVDDTDVETSINLASTALTFRYRQYGISEVTLTVRNFMITIDRRTDPKEMFELWKNWRKVTDKLHFEPNITTVKGW